MVRAEIVENKAFEDHTRSLEKKTKFGRLLNNLTISFFQKLVSKNCNPPFA